MSPPPSVPPGRRRFGQFELDIPTRELRKNGLRVRLQEQPARILEALLARPGELITREELRVHLWPADTFVDFERSLNAAVAKLRQVLADSAEQPRYVETVARRGYRFVAPVEASPAAVRPSVSLPGEPEAPSPPRGRKRWLWLAAAVVLLALASVGLSRMGPAALTSEPPTVKFVVTPPEGTRIHSISAISPDGSRLAFVAVDRSGQRTLWLRALASEAAVRLENTDEALMPFFSPDSQHVAFFAEGRLKRIPTSGGPPQVICNVNQPAGGTWNRDNIILFSQLGRLHRVSAAGGAATPLDRPAVAPGETDIDTWPQFLPDGQRFIVSTATHNGQINAVRTDILLGAIDSGRRKRLVSSRGRAAITSSGHLLFLRDDTLVAQKLDLGRELLVGEPRAVADNLSRSSAGVLVDVAEYLPVGVVPAPFSASENGVLVYHSARPPNKQLVWFNREGMRLGTAGDAREYMQIFISPDEQWAALGVRNTRIHWNLWLLHLKTNILSRLSFGEGRDADPAWGPGSDRVVYGAYRADRGENVDLMEVTLGERVSRRIYADGHSNKPEDWSPDRRLLLFRRNELTACTLPMSGDRKTEVLLQTPYLKGGLRFSPDGRWLAYMSTESGRPEIYVSRFPAMTGTRQVSVAGGFAPLWRKDGKELFYMSALGHVMSVEVKAGMAFEAGVPKLLFRPENRTPSMPQFGVTDNGQKFLVIEEPPLRAGDEHMIVTTRWNTPPAR